MYLNVGCPVAGVEAPVTGSCLWRLMGVANKPLRRKIQLTFGTFWQDGHSILTSRFQCYISKELSDGYSTAFPMSKSHATLPELHSDLQAWSQGGIKLKMMIITLISLFQFLSGNFSTVGFSWKCGLTLSAHLFLVKILKIKNWRRKKFGKVYNWATVPAYALGSGRTVRLWMKNSNAVPEAFVLDSKLCGVSSRRRNCRRRRWWWRGWKRGSLGWLLL